MDDVLADVYAEVADHLIKTGRTNPSVQQIILTMSVVRDRILKEESASLKRTIFIVALNVEQARLSKLINGF